MGTAAAEGKAGGDGPRDELGFRRRGDRTTRLEAFVDAAFAFALSLMVIAVGSVPRSPEELSLALKGVPVSEPAPPPGVVNVGGEWYYEEFANGSGVSSLGMEEAPTAPRNEEERKSILDLFNR